MKKVTDDRHLLCYQESSVGDSHSVFNVMPDVLTCENRLPESDVMRLRTNGTLEAVALPMTSPLEFFPAMTMLVVHSVEGENENRLTVTSVVPTTDEGMEITDVLSVKADVGEPVM